MEALLRTWQALTLQKRIILIASVLGTLALVGFVANMANKPSMSLLYAGLDQNAAGEVVAALDQKGVVYEIRGESIYVLSGIRDRVRMELAGEGLPAQGQGGYELLDNLSGFSTTAEMFDAAYWRAKEGELARTILAGPGIRSARVHIAASNNRPFSRNVQSSSASVTVRMSTNRPLSKQQATSIRFLVALAVPDMKPEQVAVIDAVNGVILRPGETQNSEVFETAEQRENLLRQQITDLLAVRVGADRVKVSVNVDMTTDVEKVTERLIDPESRVAISSSTKNRESSSTGTSSAVTVASNLPDGQAGGNENNSSLEEADENVNYDYSETRREKTSFAGDVERVTVAVLIDQVATTAPDGTVTYTPRTQDELTAIENLVKSAAGFDQDRGDIVTVESMQFIQPLEAGTLVEDNPFMQVISANLINIIKVLALLGVTVGFMVFVLKPMAGAALAARRAELEAQSEQERMRLEFEQQQEMFQVADMEEMEDTPVTKLRRIVSEKSEETTALLASWLEEDDKSTTEEVSS